MKRQRNMVQMKEQIKTPEKKELNEMEINNLSDAGFKHWLQGCSRNLVRISAA